MLGRVTDPVSIRQEGLYEVPASPYLVEEREALEQVLGTYSLRKIVEEMSVESPVGRRKLPREPMLRAHIIGRICGIPTIKGLVKALDKNPAMCELCGFDLIGFAENIPVYRTPSRRTFGRVFKELQQPECLKLLEECLAELTSRQLELLPDFGENVAIDSTTVKTYSNR